MIEPTKLLTGLPATLRDPLLKHYREITTNFAEGRWEPSELNGGKFCEAVCAVIEGALTGRFPAKPSKPRDMVLTCQGFERFPANQSRIGDRSLRILIPRVLLPLYEIRNNRGVGHIGGDVSPNFLDATAVHSMASWILAELIRVFHGVSTEEAQETIDALSERKVPLIWKVGDMKRVQDSRMATSDQTLLLLHAEPGWVPEANLAKWVGYSSLAMYRNRVLELLHNERLIEYDHTQARAHISPLGSKKAEDIIVRVRPG